MANQKRSKSKNGGVVNPTVGTQTQRVSTPPGARVHAHSQRPTGTYPTYPEACIRSLMRAFHEAIYLDKK